MGFSTMLLHSACYKLRFIIYMRYEYTAGTGGKVVYEHPVYMVRLRCRRPFLVACLVSRGVAAVTTEAGSKRGYT